MCVKYICKRLFVKQKKNGLEIDNLSNLNFGLIFRLNNTIGLKINHSWLLTSAQQVGVPFWERLKTVAFK